MAVSERVAHWLLLVATVATFACALIRYDGPARGYWDTYITAPAMFMNAAPIRFVLADGQKAFRVDLDGRLPDDLKHDDDFGIITKDQRIGPAISAAPMFAVFGLFGFRLLYALSIALIEPLAFMLAMRSVVVACHPPIRPPLGSALSAAILFANNPFVWSVDRMNATSLQPFHACRF